MTAATDTRRRARGEDGIYYDKVNECWVGSVSLGVTPAGKRRRRTVRGESKPAVRKKLKDLRAEVGKGVTSSARYTVGEMVGKWLDSAEVKRRAPKTKEKFRTLIDNHILPQLGAAKVRDLTADDLDEWLAGRATVLTTLTLRELLSILRRAIRLAQRAELVARNVAELVVLPTGVPGRQYKSLTLAQAMALLAAAVTCRLHAYIVVSLLTGIRTEEARKLAWDRVHLTVTKPHIEVWRSVRVGGDTKTKKSRRTLELPVQVVRALTLHRTTQEADREAAGALWTETGLVFTSTVGTPLDADNVRRDFKKVAKAAGISDDWTPRELRHSFVSLLSEAGVRIEDISQIVGHSSSRTTETVYRHELRPVITKGAEAINRAFGETAPDAD